MSRHTKERYDFSRMTVMVVDDNVYMRQVVKELLRSFGVGRVVEAVDGADALMAMRDVWVDLCICDWLMDPLDGFEFTRLLRQSDDSANPRLPVILLTGYTEGRRVRQGRDAGVTEFLAKPISAGRLFDRMRHCIEQPRPFIRSPGYTGPDRRRRNDLSYAGPDRRQRDDEGRMIENGPGLSQEEVEALLQG